MAEHRDVGAFDERARHYDDGRHGRLHHDISDRTLELALATAPAPDRVLDVGCGTGYLLRSLARRLPDASAFDGVDAAPTMIEVAAEAEAQDERLRFQHAFAEHLPFPDATFDLVVSTTSFEHWADQRQGLAQCARVTRPGGHLVLVDVISPWMLPTLVGRGRDKARTRRRATRLVTAAGYRAPSWHRVYAVVINGVTATRPG